MRRWIALAALALPTPAAAQTEDGPRFCVNRPSLVDTPCTVAPGHVLLEIGAVDWTVDRQRGEREDTVLIGDAQARFGVAEHAEVQLGWTAFGYVRERDRAGVERPSGVGDVRVGVRRNLIHPDGHALAVSLEPYITVPVGGRAIGAGDWGYGLVVPVNYDLTKTVSLQSNVSVDAAVDSDRRGRHLSYSQVTGLAVELSERVVAVGEVQVTADEDPGHHTTQSVAAVSLAFLPTKVLQLDAIVAAGLNRDTPDLRLGLGGAVLF